MSKPATGEQPSQPLAPSYPKDLFQGTAYYYARYRVPYPQQLVEDLRVRAKLTGEGRLLDLACGSGEVAIPMHYFFREVWAVDQEPEMVAFGREKAEKCDAKNIVWKVNRAEDIDAPANSFELITIGSAFHWMDREHVADICKQLLVKGQPMSVMGSNSPWTGTAEWQAVAREVIQKWIGENRRAGSGTFSRPRKPHEVVLAEADFEVEQFKFPSLYTWTLDTFMGYLYSTSFASLEVLGNKAEEFEADMRKTLSEYEPSGQFEEEMEFYYILARPKD